MRYIQDRLPSIRVPRIYAYEPAGSPRAKAAGASYMLIEGFYGNALKDFELDMTVLPLDMQKRIIGQWTTVQAELVTLTLPAISSISSLSDTGEPIVGKLESATLESFQVRGPFGSSTDYFLAAGHAAQARLAAQDDSSRWARLGAAVFCDIVSKKAFFADSEVNTSFHLNHMDLGTQNIIVDNDLRLLAIIDWGFAQSAPWQVNRYPMPFPLLDALEETKQILADPNHLAHKNVLRQEATRKMYKDGFRAAEEELRSQGRSLPQSMAEVLDSTASRIFVCFTHLGRMPEQDEELVRRIVQLAFGWEDAKTNSYLADMEAAL
ncbi:hypothetical protein LMH87_001705 [Akanthomyces muscarius]|uniref:Aminoglycoside phosphotransferase domain-containing protein n=1 Tax=Akanthomyces muscarius TaxID=2231603 RepID=A0A9W8UHU5_AKAMU|nr:hypothetical protein LMH87_001705 [Akanthomyces muscarius]KAJ4147160.1 hypothetical protein LMH87_001705 [Akanthomyces muscarius]